MDTNPDNNSIEYSQYYTKKIPSLFQRRGLPRHFPLIILFGCQILLVRERKGVGCAIAKVLIWNCVFRML